MRGVPKPRLFPYSKETEQKRRVWIELFKKWQDLPERFRLSPECERMWDSYVEARESFLKAACRERGEFYEPLKPTHESLWQRH